MLRLLIYSVAVTLVSAAGVIAAAVVERLVSGGPDPMEYAGRLVGVLVGVPALVMGAGVLFYAAVALIAGASRRTSWWVGAIAAGIPALLAVFILNPLGAPQPTSGVASGSPEAALAGAVTAVVISAAAGALLIRPLLSRCRLRRSAISSIATMCAGGRRRCQCRS